MFFNLRYVSVVVFCIASMLVVVVGLYYKQLGRENIARSISHKEATIYGIYFQNHLYQRYFPVLHNIARQQQQTPLSIPEYLLLQKEMEEFFDAPDIANVELYVNGKRIFQMRSMIVMEPSPLMRWFVRTQSLAVNHDIAPATHESQILNNVGILDGADYTRRHVLRDIYKPYLADLPEQYSALRSLDTTLVVYYDITGELNTMSRMAYLIICLVIAVFAAFTGVVLIMSIRAEKVIEQQHQTSLEIETARETAEAESKAKSQFLANVSHELRTPLNAIIGFSDIIKSESMGPLQNEQYKEFINDINSSGQHLLSLINDILDFSKADEGKLEVDFEDIDLTKMLSICARMVLPRAEEAGINLKVDLNKEHIVLVVDAKRMKQVVLNLLSNAVKFTPSGGDVKLRCWREQESVIIEIADSGVGMEPQDLARALSPFGQVDNSLSKRYEGTGLGLPLTKKLVELMGGRFDIKSEEKIGTIVTILMPYKAAEEPTSAD